MRVCVCVCVSVIHISGCVLTPVDPVGRRAAAVCQCPSSGAPGRGDLPDDPPVLDPIPSQAPGRISSPAERRRGRGEVNVEDMKDEMYVPRKKTFYPFSGRGYRLGR